MRHKQAFLPRALLLAALLAPAALAPSALAAEDIPAPTQLRAAIRAEAILLSWADSGGASRYAVYRSSVPIEASSFGAATKLGEVEAGVQAYVDRPPTTSPYYYLVLALDEKGLAYPSFVPKQNLTLAPVSVEAARPLPQPALAAPAAEGQAAGAEAPVSGLAASARSDSVLLSYKPKKAGMRLVLYRGSSAFDGAPSLLDAVLVSSFEDSGGSFVDYPVAGLDYWYALLDETELESGKVVLKAGENATLEPVRLAARPGPAGIAAAPFASRVPPLPSLYFDEKVLADSSPIEASQRLPERRELDPETAKAMALLLEGTKDERPSQPSTRVLREELAAMGTASAAGSGGEGYALAAIVKGELAKGDWAKASTALKQYLSLNRSKEATTRARFYLGEALAKDGAYKEALFEFLETREAYPAETGPWLDYLLDILAKDR